MITDRDKDILNHFKTFKYATIGHLEEIFFKEQQYSYNICRRRLRELRNTGYIKVEKNLEINKNIYMLNRENIKMPSLETILILDLIAKLKNNNCEIIEFAINKKWENTDIKSKAFCIFTIKNRRYHFFIEVNTEKRELDLKKYDKLHESKEVQKYLGKEFFPKLLVLTDSKITDLPGKTKVIQVKTDLTNILTDILLSD